MDRLSRDIKRLRDKVYDALWENHISGAEFTKLYESGYIGNYTSLNDIDEGEGNVLLTIIASEVQIPSAVTLDDYFSAQAIEIAQDIIKSL